jgi:hypothetical protein
MEVGEGGGGVGADQLDYMALCEELRELLMSDRVIRDTFRLLARTTPGIHMLYIEDKCLAESLSGSKLILEECAASSDPKDQIMAARRALGWFFDVKQGLRTYVDYEDMAKHPQLVEIAHQRGYTICGNPDHLTTIVIAFFVLNGETNHIGLTSTSLTECARPPDPAESAAMNAAEELAVDAIASMQGGDSKNSSKIKSTCSRRRKRSASEMEEAREKTPIVPRTRGGRDAVADQL